MSRVVLSLGSNLGDSRALLGAAVDGLGDTVVAVSHTYATPPWGGVEQDDFLNLVVLAEDADADAREWLLRAQRLEQVAERTRVVRWGPRTLDVDLVACDDVVSDDPELTLPHPRAHLRAFVLRPWLDVQPDAVLHGVPVTEHLAALSPAERDGVRRVEDVR
ncbi:2-amino-4-hydroxy-6-hydroxymethyldihydropteridine diphosphokinase [Rhodococcoides corynebacterioides]|uniref:2-amino-4-hydroxy-6-hydroxymethyldihydropteridine diphosphokinase n=1 Tax=Rhodococcoides corynebacterioides TaxID=53972 RepID=A0ABS7P6R0_9NOCA|nr:2-amino-4-hydroxy-6-hydroxymethyldihydropteridine diphosphokinase [Rhodococcus corynebacterioides]MBY6366846.1 2-amino-4-hydroxy-6-hydroxymethyldihydropteridine diphosphokinase [Rhodococcus corynebacterioides]MBY6409129.1 2-amino-4-hydroxy-6-hydroxymethyldihydropteridine diphosphokinase [Rhodococcus corynebacterioides]